MSFLKENSIGLLIALAIGVIIAAPPVIFRFSEDYHGFPMMKTNTESHYAAQVKEVYDGHYGLGNPFLADLKDEPYLFPPLSPTVMGWFGKIFHLDIMTNIMLLRFLITSAMAFFVYLFTAALSKNKFAGYVAAPFVMLGYSLVDPGHIMAIIRNRGIPPHAGFLDYGRPVNPQMSSFIFFGYLYFLWRALSEASKKWKMYALAAAIFLGLSFYAYLFTWTFLFSLNGFLFFVYAWKKEWTVVRRIVAVSVGAGLLAIPYVLHSLRVSGHPDFAASAPRFGFVHVRTPAISRMMAGAFAVFLLLFRRMETPMRRFFAAFFFTAFFVVNEQVITNMFVFNHHYHWYYNTPLAIVLFSVSLFLLRERFFNFLKPSFVAGGAVFMLLGYGIAAQATAYRGFLPSVIEEQKYAPIIQWLNTETEKDTTVFAAWELPDFIASLAHNNVYYNGTAIYTLVSDERLLHAYLMYLYLDGVPTADIRTYLESHRNDISGFVYGYTYSFLPDTCFGCFPDHVIDDLVKKYEMISDGTFADALRAYPVDYLVWDKQKNPTWRPDRFGFPVLAAFSELVVYDLRASASAQPQTYYPADESGQTHCLAGYCESSPTRASKTNSLES